RDRNVTGVQTCALPISAAWQHQARVNLNADIGEGAGEDEAVLACIDSANVACGVHAGSVSISIGTARRCQALGIQVGAHPGYDEIGRASCRERVWRWGG